MPTLRNFFAIVKTDWLWWLTLRRLSVTRSFDMPVTTLERLHGAERQDRKNVLQLVASGPAMWLTVLMVHIEILLVYGILGVALLMKPGYFEVDWLALVLEDIGWMRYLTDTLTLVVMAILAPFYTLAGFSLYLNRRIALEGWDIELHFQNIVAGSSARAGKALVVAVLGCVLVFPALLPGVSTAHAAPIENRLESPTPVESHGRIETILAGDAFHQRETISRWQRKDTRRENPDPSIPPWLQVLADLAERLADGVTTLGRVFEVALWIVAACTVAYLVYRYRRGLAGSLEYVRSGKPDTESPEIPEVLFGMDVTRESLPQDVAGAARKLWDDQQPRDAVSLLYRASLSRLMHSHRCPFASGDTEEECLRRVEQLGKNRLSRFMADLTRQWQRIAYGHRKLSQDDFESLCSHWTEVLA
jgi:hypothetical protein